MRKRKDNDFWREKEWERMIFEESERVRKRMTLKRERERF